MWEGPTQSGGEPGEGDVCVCVYRKYSVPTSCLAEHVQKQEGGLTPIHATCSSIKAFGVDMDAAAMGAMAASSPYSVRSSVHKYCGLLVSLVHPLCTPCVPRSACLLPAASPAQITFVNQVGPATVHLDHARQGARTGPAVCPSSSRVASACRSRNEVGGWAGGLVARAVCMNTDEHVIG